MYIFHIYLSLNQNHITKNALLCFTNCLYIIRSTIIIVLFIRRVVSMICSRERETSLIRLFLQEFLKALNNRKKETRRRKEKILFTMYKEKIVIKSNIGFGTRDFHFKAIPFSCT